MKVVKAEQVRDELIGLRPVYNDIGNVTEVLLANGEMLLDRRVLRSVLKGLAQSFGLDLSAQRRNLQQKLGRKMVIPVYFNKRRVFVPLKMRRAVTENDQVYGYIDVSCIVDQVEAGDKKSCLVKLSNGMEIEVLSSRKTVLGSKELGTRLLGSLQEGKKQSHEEEQVMESARVWAQSMLEVRKISIQLDRIESSIKHNPDPKGVM